MPTTAKNLSKNIHNQLINQRSDPFLNASEIKSNNSNLGPFSIIHPAIDNHLYTSTSFIKIPKRQSKLGSFPMLLLRFIQTLKKS